MSSFRVKLWDTTGTGRGRGSLKAIIDDAKSIGGSEYANDVGTFFMTLPANHPQISECQPLLRHYSIERFDGSTYVPIFNGLLTDYDATDNEAVIYGEDYLGLLKHTISAANTSYSNTIVSNIISAQFQSAIDNETNTRLGFLSLGTIEATTKTTTVLTSYEERLHFMQSLVGIIQGGGTTRPMVYISARSNPIHFNFATNRGSDNTNMRLEYGSNVIRFKYRPYGDFSTRVNSVGIKRDGASIIYSTQTYASETTYGWMTAPAAYQDVVNQTALDDLALHQARVNGRIGKTLGLVFKSGAIVPWDGYDLGDSFPVYIDRGPVSISGDMFTLWGLQWLGKPDGSEELGLNLLPKDV